jgi:hypothetical protein
MRILCFLGLHKWEMQRVVEYPMEYVVAYFDSEVCSRCGKHKIKPEILTKGLPQNYNVLN